MSRQPYQSIILAAEDRAFAKEIYGRYAVKEGAEFIASEIALAYLAACLRIFRPQVVLECGSGIGTQTDALLSHESGVTKVIGIESNDFCLRALNENLANHNPSRLTIITNLKDLADLHLKADMIVADGGFESEEEFRTARAGTVVYIEGIRSGFRENMKAYFTRKERCLTIDFRAYSATYTYKIFISRRFWIPLPRPRRVYKTKGCFIGIVR